MERILLFLIEHFPDLMDINLTATVVIVFVLSVRVLMKGAPKLFSCALWGVVLLRLLVPVSIESPVSLVTERTEFSSMVDVNEVLPNLQFETPADAANNSSVREHTPDGEVLSLVGTILNPQTYLTFLWLGGMAVMLLWGAVDWIRLRRRLRVVVPAGEGIFLADDIGSPFVMGLLRPKIYLPSSLTEQEQGYILLHEKHHIRRFDHVVKWLFWLALCIHWFNPFVWAAFIFAGRDMEMSCDEAVIRDLDPGVRADYSASLLNLATGRRIIAGTPLAFGEGDPKGRIENIANWKKPAVWVIILCVAVCAVLAVCLLTDPQIPEPPKTIDFTQLNTENVKSVVLDNAHNGKTTFITDQNDVDEICAIVKSVYGVNGISGRHYYEGSYVVTLKDAAHTDIMTIQFGDSDAFFHGTGEDGYAVRYELEGLTIGGIIRLLSKYDESGFDWNLSSTAKIWGVRLSVEDAAPSGLTVVFGLDTYVMSEDFLEKNRLHFGEFYQIERLAEGQWTALERYDAEPAAPAAVEQLTPITADSGAQVRLDWTEVYGTLEPGNYRITLRVSRQPEEERPETLPIYAEFTLGQPDGLAGSWRTEVTALGEGVDPEGAYYLQLFLDGFGGGAQYQHMNGRERSDAFSYRLEDGTLHIAFEGQEFAFSCRMEEDRLILTQNHREIVYEKVIQ